MSRRWKNRVSNRVFLVCARPSFICSSHRNNTRYCPTCRGTGKISCTSCNGLGGFLHSPTLHVSWHTRQSTWYRQNSYLPDKKIKKAALTLFWNARIVPWSKSSSIADAVASIDETTPDIDLKASVIEHYGQQHLKKIGDSKALRRWECFIERLDFEEITYTMGEKYTNQHYSELGRKGLAQMEIADSFYFPRNYISILSISWTTRQIHDL